MAGRLAKLLHIDNGTRDSHHRALTEQPRCTTCTDVINLQCEDDRSRDTQCVTAVADFLGVIGAASSEADPQIADLVVKLLELYRDDQRCKIAETELPEAIETAAGKVLDGTVKVEYVQIVEQIKGCDFSATAAINPEPIPASSN